MKARAREVLSLDQQGRGTLADALAACDPASEGARLAANDPAAILYTSGTTGRSKGAVLTQRNLAANALALHEAWGFGPDDVLLHILPIYHAHGLFVALHTSLLNGTRMRFHRRFDPVAVVRDLARSTVLMGVPTHYSRLLAEPTFTREACASMRLFVSGSAPLLEETFHAFRERSGHTLLERYGMTETGMNASNPLSGERVAGSVGPPLSGVEARVVADDGTPLPDGEVGSLEVRGENVFREYWRMPEKTQSEFRSDGFFITGDLARIDERGYLQLVGRAKDLVITGGLNVYPREVEEVIDALPGVVESAVFGVPHADLGEGLTAVVVPQDAANPPAEDEIRAAVRGQRAAFKVPKRVLIAAALPRNAMGKVLKSELRERHAALYSD
jgi:malonyl-CoA/methylmalonyl-CoA synthetase